MMQGTAMVRLLTDFVDDSAASHPDEILLHDVKRLLLNQLKASAEAFGSAVGMPWLARSTEHARRHADSRLSQLWWSGTVSTVRHAAARNRRLLDMLDFGDTHIPSLGAGTTALLPLMLAHAEEGRATGQRFLWALAIGLEVAIATQAVPFGLAAGLCILRQHSRASAAALLQQCLAAPHVKGPGLARLGHAWQLRNIALHCRPVPATMLAPLEAMLALREHALGRQLRRLRVELSAQALHHMQEDPLTLRHCLDTAWALGDFGAEERLTLNRAAGGVAASCAHIEIVASSEFPTPVACRLAAQFDDGSNEHLQVKAFLGSPERPLSAPQLSELFRSAAEPVVLPRRAGEILGAVWGLDHTSDVRELTRLLVRPA